MKAVILDTYTVTLDDLNWNCLNDGTLKEKFDLTIYDRTPADKLVERIADNEIVMTNKCKLTREVLEKCPKVKFIQELATGYDNIDLKAAKDLGIGVSNVPKYSTESVVQHTFALILEATNNVGRYTDFINKDAWVNSVDFCFIDNPIFQISGKSLGIVGYGTIGKRVAEVAKAFGMTVNVYSQNKEAAMKSDIITLHCPATAENKGFVNKEFISQMKDGAILINTARGALINEEDLVQALKSGKLKAAAVDVINGEPERKDHPFIGCPNLYITPHIAWSTKEAREVIISVSHKNIEAFLKGEKLNRVE